jgi:hypothetical protein
VAGATLFSLVDPLDRLAGKSLFDLLTAMAVHHAQFTRTQGPRRAEHMGQQGPAGQRVQYLGEVGTHTLALTGSEYDDSDVGCHGGNYGRSGFYLRLPLSFWAAR